MLFILCFSAVLLVEVLHILNGLQKLFHNFNCIRTRRHTFNIFRFMCHKCNLFNVFNEIKFIFFRLMHSNNLFTFWCWSVLKLFICWKMLHVLQKFDYFLSFCASLEEVACWGLEAVVFYNFNIDVHHFLNIWRKQHAALW